MNLQTQSTTGFISTNSSNSFNIPFNGVQRNSTSNLNFITSLTSSSGINNISPNNYMIKSTTNQPTTTTTTTQITNQQFTNKPIIQNYLLQKKSLESKENYDLYMDLSQMTTIPQSSMRRTGCRTVYSPLVKPTLNNCSVGTKSSILEEETGSSPISSILKDDDDHSLLLKKSEISQQTNLLGQQQSEDKIITLVTKNASLIDRYNEKQDGMLSILEGMKKHPIDNQQVTIVPCMNSSSMQQELCNGTSQQFSNYQLEELLRVMWIKQQSQSKEIQELKDVVSELRNLLLIEKTLK